MHIGNDTDMGVVLYDLEPFTKYAIYVQAYSTALSKTSHTSPIVYFVTEPSGQFHRSFYTSTWWPKKLRPICPIVLILKMLRLTCAIFWFQEIFILNTNWFKHFMFVIDQKKLPHILGHPVGLLDGFNVYVNFVKQEVKVIWQKVPHGGPIPWLGVTPGGRNLYHWIPGVGVPISVP